ncbi:MAG: NUDIX hydrolase [Brevundimonas sp.]|jgi:hypothetical protein|uniref:NUDIX hydrolase n=1 Tax=Brevundimonas sp. TaxID=1871086 RepID=UPI00391D823A
MAGGAQGVLIGLSAVVITLSRGEACVLTTGGSDSGIGLPFGPFDPGGHRTFELALRNFVTEQTGFSLGYVEQLYTFGDAGREAPRAALRGEDAGPGGEPVRVVSVGYLALTRLAEGVGGEGVNWSRVLDFFPWEDFRNGRPAVIDSVIAPGLSAWIDAAPDAPTLQARRARADSLFALHGAVRWREEQVLERYQLLYEAGLVFESRRDNALGTGAEPPQLGRAMISDHRRILATALGRLRGKLKYRPILFELTPELFTLSQLQSAAEAIVGMALHKQNFRRGVERTGLVTATGRMATATGGRPAELFTYRGQDPMAAQALGLPLPGLRQDGA